MTGPGLTFLGLTIIASFLPVPSLRVSGLPVPLTSLPKRSDKADVDTLQLVQIIWRHGDRTPVVQYPTDPLQNETIWYPYSTGFEAITQKGKQMHYDFGKYLRTRYDGFLSPVYSPKEILVQSSDVDRTIMSAQSNMAGMWPPTPLDPKSQWPSLQTNLNWQPIPIHTVSKKLDNYISFKAACPRFAELKDEYIRNSTFAKSINEDADNLELCEIVKKNTGLPRCDFEVISDVWDTLHIQKGYNLTLPSWVDPVFDRMGKIAPLFFDPRVLLPTEEAKRVKAGPLMNLLVKNMEGKANGSKDVPKMVAVSGHDTTNSLALAAIDVFETQFPTYASAAIFEMHKLQDEYFVRVFFRNETGSPPYEFQVPKCAYPCPLTTFKEIVKPIIVDGEAWTEACKPGGQQVPIVNSTIIAVVEG